ncbi:MAG: hypothetical protein MI975_08875 [Cytophagales bacterium]|nr:hypothetical protein [Cytophagales bacterium]
MPLKLTILSLFFIYSSFCYSQNDPEDIITSFFDKYENNKINEAVDFIFSTNDFSSTSSEQIDNIKAQLVNSAKLLGKLHGKDNIKIKKIEDTVELHSFLLRYDLQPIRFTFIFYKPSNEWRLQNFLFDDEILDELSNASKIK